MELICGLYVDKNELSRIHTWKTVGCTSSTLQGIILVDIEHSQIHELKQVAAGIIKMPHID